MDNKYAEAKIMIPQFSRDFACSKWDGIDYWRDNGIRT